MSITSVILPILSVLSVAQETHLGHVHSWRAVNKQQQVLIDRYLPKTHELKKLLPNELRSCVSEDVALVNRFLRDNGFTIQLKEKGGGDAKDGCAKDGIAVASILDLALTWKKAGKKTTLSVEDKSYPAVFMKQGYTVQRTSDGHDILSIDAKNGDKVYMTQADKPLGGFELLDTIEQIASLDKKETTKSYTGVKFPMVELSQQEDVSWLLGLWYDSSPEWEVVQALQETRFAMNEKGAHAQSAVAVEIVLRCIPTKPCFVIDKPFYLWIERPGMSVPLFAGYIDMADWKEPDNKS